ncbi:hypothetical protein THAOC_30803 [Thalassiosira oceanica]|uniref:Uncharacterized protein n=1 Tax=Thalassiosira oceanica TaxID=159749 RepID=K0RAN6_THAOC|nr:hypothetical protein THAOC_30803 [Thalassiosira oceanica]|eukprot:EJK50255.1 hypothetical protein THAOC_30803 [Thalassiosira oceanica]
MAEYSRVKSVQSIALFKTQSWRRVAGWNEVGGLLTLGEIQAACGQHRAEQHEGLVSPPAAACSGGRLRKGHGAGAVDDPARPGPAAATSGDLLSNFIPSLELESLGREQAERDLRDRKRGKGGKGKKDDDLKDGAKARRSKSGKVKSGKGDTGTNHCLEAFNEIMSVGTYIYGKGGVCEDDFEVQLMCALMYSGCSYYEKSLRASSTFALDTCVPFDLPDVLAYDAETGMCTLTGIDLKRPEEDSCQVPTAEYSTKITFHADDSSALYIDFSSNGGDSYYTEGEDDETRIATPYSDEGVRARRAEVCGAEVGNGLFSSCKGDGEYCGYNGNIRETGCWKDPNVCCSKVSGVQLN